MKIKYRLIYFFVSFLSYIALALFEFFVLDDVLDMISTKYIVHLIIMIICLIIINPIIVYYIICKLPIKPKLKTKKKLDDSLNENK